MTTNPRSLAYDGAGRRLICEVCVEWTAFEDLYVDAQGQRWDVCRPCAEAEPGF